MPFLTQGEILKITVFTESRVQKWGLIVALWMVLNTIQMLQSHVYEWACIREIIIQSGKTRGLRSEASGTSQLNSGGKRLRMKLSRIKEVGENQETDIEDKRTMFQDGLNGDWHWKLLRSNHWIKWRFLVTLSRAILIWWWEQKSDWSSFSVGGKEI